MQIIASSHKAIKTTHILVMLIKATIDQFDSVVGQRDERIFESIDQLWVMAFQERKDGIFSINRGSLQTKEVPRKLREDGLELAER